MPHTTTSPTYHDAHQGELATALARLATTPNLLVGLDFDGCLAPLVDNPMAARMLPESAAAIRVLQEIPDTHVALISGRTLHALVQLAEPGPGTYLAGSHGAERGHIAQNGHLTLAPAQLTTAQQELRAHLDEQLQQIRDGHPGTRLEYKDISVSIHTRGLDAPLAESALSAATAGPGSLPGVRLRPGHDVVELAVVHITKGDALSDIAELVGAGATFYAGDDATDEDAFSVQNGDDVGIRVGPGATQAPFRVQSPQEIAAVLTELAKLRQSWAASRAEK